MALGLHALKGMHSGKHLLEMQEATALYELMRAMPQAALEEVGLCRVDPAVLSELYGFTPGELPPLGASPDGLIRQRHPSPASAVCLPLL